VRLASITLCSARAKDIVADALRSVIGHVDVNIIVDLGLDQETINVIAQASDGNFRIWDGIHNPTAPQLAECRNIGLRYAAELGYDWALMLDTDERMVFPPDSDVRGWLATVQEPLIVCKDADRGYAKERFIKLPMAAPYEGAVHEHIPATVPRVLCANIFFRELEKSPEQIAAGIEAIEREILAGKDTSPRAAMYLGSCHAAKQEWGTALAYYEDAIEASPWDEERAWGHYCRASVYLDLDDPNAALHAAVEGLTEHPGCAELAWLAGRACMALDRPLHAVAWARMAACQGTPTGGQAIYGRTYFSHPHGLGRGPIELLRDAHTALGNVEQAAEYTTMLEGK